MPIAFLDTPPPTIARRALTESDAIDIWIQRWLRIRPKDIIRRYGCDPRRVYEIWEEKRFAGSRAKALETFAARYPSLVERVDFGLHRRLPLRADQNDQLSLFE